MFKLIWQKSKQIAFVGSLLLLSGCARENTGILNPKGIITYKERILMFDALALMLIVVIPVIIMSFAFVYRYRQTHGKGQYKPNWSHSVFLETIWWGVPCVIIVILGILTWVSSHRLDPYREIPNIEGKKMQIEAYALPWKWLFVYPDQNIAAVNFLELPKDRQVEFLLTSDNVAMSAFFIPQLGSQIYTMAGMRTRLHIVPTHNGTFEGMNAQYNGDGFSDMRFDVKVVDESEFKKWVSNVKSTAKPLSKAKYQVLRQPSIADPVAYYAGVTPGLFEQTIKSYKMPEHPSN